MTPLDLPPPDRLTDDGSRADEPPKDRAPDPLLEKDGELVEFAHV